MDIDNISDEEYEKHITDLEIRYQQIFHNDTTHPIHHVCARCGTDKFQAVIEGEEPSKTFHLNNVLLVSFGGGYGMFTDPTSKWEIAELKDIVICHDCAHKLCENEPWIGKILEPEMSHTHTQEYLDSHPDHLAQYHKDSIEYREE